MAKSFSMTSTNSKEVRESPKLVLPGENPVFSITIDGTGTIANDATLTMKLFKGSTDISSTGLTGSLSVSGMTITTKTVTGLVGGNEYFAVVYFTLNGVLTGRFVRLICMKEGSFN
jgi:hypothetical protein